MSEVKETNEENSREQRLEKRNEELKAKLKELQDKNSDMIHEIAQLKSVITEQVCKNT